MKKIAIVGAGISGLTAAYYLKDHHQITLFEANDYLGGHTATVDVPDVNHSMQAIDTGFIVFNDRTYPNFIQLLHALKVAYQPTEMSFSVHEESTGFEYNGHDLRSLFAQKRHYFSPKFYRFLFDIFRFNRLAKKQLKSPNSEEISVGAFLAQHAFPDDFCRLYLLPMGAAIWSMPLGKMREMPLCFFLRFFENHGLLDVTHRPQWYVIKGGSREYVRALLSQLPSSAVRCHEAVVAVRRGAHGVSIETTQGQYAFDEVVMACHSDQALALLHNPSESEIAILSAIPYQTNQVTLHTDTAWLPKSPTAWAAWNYRVLPNRGEETPVTVTYYMNRLQGLSLETDFCVTLNQAAVISPDKVLRQFEYAHPVFGFDSVKAQRQKSQIQGKNRTWFCGAYWGYGFHEDGVNSALEVVSALNVSALRKVS